MDWAQRATECHHRQRVVYPAMIKARKVYERYSKLWTYWSNRAFEADRRVVEVNIIPTSKTRDKVEKEKSRFNKKFNLLSLEEQLMLIDKLRKELK